jgi:TolB-like protein
MAPDPPPRKSSRILRAVGVYAGVAWVVLQVVGTLRENLDLPRSVFVASLVLLSAGLVIVVATAWVQSLPGMAERAQAEEVPEAWEFDRGDLVRSLSDGRLPHLTWARAAVGGAAAFLLLFGFAGLWVVVQDRGESFLVRSADAAVAPGIAVMPFSVSGEGGEVWREGMMDLLSTNLDGVGGLRTIHTRTVLARWRERSLDDGADLADVLDAARSAGARLALVGSAVALGPSVRLRAELFDLDEGGETQVGEANVEGPEADILSLVDRLSIDVVQRILRAEDASAVLPSLESLTTSSVPALRAFLEGEALYRRADFAGATLAFKEAVREDSLFAMAHHRLSGSMGWNLESMAEGAAHGRRARELASRLPSRDSILLDASSRATGSVRDAGGVTDLQALSRQYPDDPEVWYWLGEAYNHTGWKALVPVEEMGAAFERAIALDSVFVPAYIHAIESALSFHDMATARRLLDSFQRHAPGGEDLERMAFMVRFTRGTEGWAEAASTLGDGKLVALIVNMDDAGIGTELLRDRLLEEAMRRRAAGNGWQSDGVLRLRAGSLLSRGKWREAEALLPDVSPSDRPGLALAARFAGLDALDASMIPDEEGIGSTVWGALVAADLGDAGTFAERRARLEEAPPEGFTDEDLGSLAQIVDAWALWRREGSAALPALEAAHHEAQRGGIAASFGTVLALALEQVHTELGDPAAALPYARSHRADAFATYRTARLYEALGRTDDAARLWPLLEQAWNEADEGIPQVEAMR